MTRAQRTRWDDLDARRYISTKFFDIPTLRLLGLEESVRTFMGIRDIDGLVDKCVRTYPDLVREFLATFAMASEDSFTFRLGGANQAMTFEELKNVFGITGNPSARWSELPRYLHPVTTMV